MNILLGLFFIFLIIQSLSALPIYRPLSNDPNARNLLSEDGEPEPYRVAGSPQFGYDGNSGVRSLAYRNYRVKRSKNAGPTSNRTSNRTKNKGPK